MTIVNDKLIVWLSRELQIRGWSHRELARRAGLSQTAVSTVISEQRKPGWDFCAAIAGPLGKTPEEVLRMAGLLNQPSIDDDLTQELMETMSQLSPDRKEFILKLIRTTYREQEEAKKKETTRIPSVS